MSNARILLIEDEPIVRGKIKKVLTDNEYLVVVAASGSEAELKFFDSPDSIHAVITDLTLPDQDGLETLLNL